MQDEDLQRVHELFAAVGKSAPPRTDISAMQWLKEQVCKGYSLHRSMAMPWNHPVPCAYV